MAEELDIKIVEVGNAPDVAAAKQLVLNYIGWLNLDLSHQNIDAELDCFPGEYAPPKGFLLLAKINSTPAGVVGLRPLAEEGVCEMKRLWVDPAFTGLGLGRLLCEQFIKKAKSLGYARARLDTLARLKAANRLYRSIGFREIGAYMVNPQPDALFFERDL